MAVLKAPQHTAWHHTSWKSRDGEAHPSMTSTRSRPSAVLHAVCATEGIQFIMATALLLITQLSSS